jgi:hypothetical protein
MSDDQNFIQHARQKVFDALRKNAIARRREKLDRSEEDAAIELFLDTCAAEGLDPKNPRDLVTMLAAWELKKGGESFVDDADDPANHPLNY